MPASTKTDGAGTSLKLDSSCWIEYFRDTSRAELFATVAENPEQLNVPVITIYEVSKKLHREIGARVAAYAEAVMCRGRVIDFDSLIYASAQLHRATLWTQDQHFDGLPGVRYFSKIDA